ncbi:uncharacterized protein LOC117640499 [Thrips palmi]|uniref:Uncharacterized protein LOC117640499 n=1 Tax=Thrips palmi TaxID=161013 RepID=A0A6P8ZI34_THRPL|nr:uncharacterized protein LOC117640499 [Thrips palmi]
MPGSTVRAKVSKGVRGATAPVSERQQLALLMQMTSDDNQGPGPGSGPSEVGGGGSGGSAVVAAVTSPAANPSPSRSRARNERGETPLHLAAIRGDLSQVERLLEAGADPNVADFAGECAPKFGAVVSCLESPMEILFQGDPHPSQDCLPAGRYTSASAKLAKPESLQTSECVRSQITAVWRTLPGSGRDRPPR